MSRYVLSNLMRTPQPHRVTSVVAGSPMVIGLGLHPGRVGHHPFVERGASLPHTLLPGLAELLELLLGDAAELGGQGGHVRLELERRHPTGSQDGDHVLAIRGDDHLVLAEARIAQQLVVEERREKALVVSPGKGEPDLRTALVHVLCLRLGGKRERTQRLFLSYVRVPK